MAWPMACPDIYYGLDSTFTILAMTVETQLETINGSVEHRPTVEILQFCSSAVTYIVKVRSKENHNPDNLPERF